MAKNQKKGDRSRSEKSEEERLEKLRREANGLIRDGQVSQAMRRITSYGVADINNPAVMLELKEKFPPRRHELPATIQKVSPVDSFPELRENLLSLEPGPASLPVLGV